MLPLSGRHGAYSCSRPRGALVGVFQAAFVAALLSLPPGCGCAARSHANDAAATEDAGTCADDLLSEGCPCAGAPRECYEGPPGTLGVGVCAGGLRSCIRAVFGPCVGQTLAAPESCNAVDDDCDGETDEDACESACVGAGCGGWGELPDGLRLGADDGVTLVLPADDPVAVLWFAEQHGRTVAKVDTRAREVIARYRASPGCPLESVERIADVAVDPEGNAYVVVTGGWDGPWRVLSIAHEACADADGDGVVETSEGPDDIRPYLEDECLRWSLDLGLDFPMIAVERMARGEGPERLLWIANSRTHRIFAVDPESGLETGDEIVLEGEGVYFPDQIAFDAQGHLFAHRGGNRVAIVDTSSGRVDWTQSARIWIGPASSQDPAGRLWFDSQIQTFDFDAEEWTWPRPYDLGRGWTMVPVVFASTGIGYGLQGSALVTYDLEADSFEIDRDAAMASFSISLDRDGFLWELDEVWDGICPGNVCCDLEYDTAAAYVRDPWEGDREVAIEGGLRRGQVFREASGTTAHDVTTGPVALVRSLEGCEGASWTRLFWDAQLPGGTHLELEVMASDDPVPSGVWFAIDPPSPALLPDLLPRGRFLHLRATLHSNGDQPPDERRTPELISAAGEFSCE